MIENTMKVREDQSKPRFLGAPCLTVCERFYFDEMASYSMLNRLFSKQTEDIIRNSNNYRSKQSQF